MAHRLLGSEADALAKPGKPVASASDRREQDAPAALEDGVWSLALACGLSLGRADSARRLYLRATRRGGDFAALFRRWWQEQTLAPLSEESVLQPWATELHQRIAAVLRELDLLGDQPLLLPCRTCGRLFTSIPPRFARGCGSCQPYTPAGRPHWRGSAVMASVGFYPAGPHRPTRGQSLLCAHPDCIRLFLSNRPDREYCDEHAQDRKAAQRARRRTSAPKHERYRFRIDGSALPVRARFVVGEHERTCVITAAGYQARDEPEFVQLLQLAAAGPFSVEPATS